MGALSIQIGGVELRDYVLQETIRIIDTGHSFAARCQFVVEDRLNQAPWITINEKDDIAIRDGATWLFGGKVAHIAEEHDGHFRRWTVRGSDYTILLDEWMAQGFWEEGTSDSAIIDALVTESGCPIDSSTHVDTLRASMPQTHFDWCTVREALDHICRVTGGMYYVDFEQYLHYFSVDEGDNAPFGLSTEPDMATTYPYGEYKLNRDATKVINRICVSGNGLNVWREDAASIAVYGPLEGIVRDKNINTEADAEEYGDWILSRHAWPKGEPELVCWRPGLRAGMRIQLTNSVWGFGPTWYSIRQIETKCTGGTGATAQNPQYEIKLRLGLNDAPGRPIEPLPDVSPAPPKPPPYVPPDEGAKWAKEVYIATKDQGVFHTTNFVADENYIHGVPTWTAVNTGINIADDILGFRGDPFRPSYRQYLLNVAGFYKREGGGNWVCKMTLAQAKALANIWTGEKFGINCLECNMNHDGFVAFMVSGYKEINMTVMVIISTDYGETFTGYELASLLTGPIDPVSFTVGANRGTSSYEAGDAMYVAVVYGGNMYLMASYDKGVTWAWKPKIGNSTYYPQILVDPADQGKLLVGAGDGAGPYDILDSEDHGATLADFDGANHYGETLSSFYHLSIAADVRRTIRIGSYNFSPDTLKRTRDDGASFDEYMPERSADNLGVSIIHDSPDNLYLMRLVSGVAGDGYHTLWASSDESQHMVPKSGVDPQFNAAGTSIPYNHGGIRGILQVWTPPTRHDIGGTEHDGQINEGQIEDLIGTVVAPAEHDLLGASHPDTLAAAVVSGDVIVGNAMPEWSRLAVSVPAANVRNVLGIDNGETIPSWKTALDNTNPANIAAAASPGTSLIFSHRDHVHAHPAGLGSDLHHARYTNAEAVASVEAADPLALAHSLIVAGTIAVGTNPATAGTIRLPNMAAIAGRNAANNGNITMFLLNASDRVQLGTILTTAYQMVSTLATGTAPFVIASTTKADNLNADLLDGFHASTTPAVSTIPVQDVSGDLYLKGKIYPGDQATRYIFDADNMINVSGNFRVNTRLYGLTNLYCEATNGFLALKSTAGNHMYIDAGGIYYWRDVDAANATRMSLDSATGDLDVTGCVSDATCEIMTKRDAVAIIKDILTIGTGKQDEYGHERMNMSVIHSKYPFLIHKTNIEFEEGVFEERYLDKLGAKSDLLYVAVMQLDKRLSVLERSKN